jgi:hypothetical protein
MMAHSFASAVSTLLAEPILEGAFRIWDGQTDVTDEFSELRFRDPQLGGYLDRTRVERELLVRPLTVWLRGSWAFQRRHDEAAQDTAAAPARLERNEWTLIVPPGAVVSITSPRRAFAVVTPVAGAVASEPPPPLVAGRTVEIQAAQTGVITSRAICRSTPPTIRPTGIAATPTNSFVSYEIRS